MRLKYIIVLLVVLLLSLLYCQKSSSCYYLTNNRFFNVKTTKYMNYFVSVMKTTKYPFISLNKQNYVHDMILFTNATTVYNSSPLKNKNSNSHSKRSIDKTVVDVSKLIPKIIPIKTNKSKTMTTDNVSIKAMATDNVSIKSITELQNNKSPKLESKNTPKPVKLEKYKVFKEEIKKSRKPLPVKPVYDPNNYTVPVVVEHFLDHYYSLPTPIPSNLTFGGYVDIADFVDYYIYWHNQVASNPNIGTICFFPTRHGLANKLFGMLSSLMFAMLTGRKFEICGWRIFNRFFDPPFHIKQRPPQFSAPKLDFTHSCQGYPDLNNINLTKFDETHSYIIQSNCRMVYDFYGNVAFGYRLQEIGVDLRYYRPQDNDAYVYHTLLTKIFPLSKELQKYVDNNSKDWYKYCVVGIHIRTGDAAFQHNQEFNEKMISRIKPVAQKTQEIEKECTKESKWFLITDNQYLKQTFKNEYPEKIIFYNSSLIHSGVDAIYKFNQGVIDTFVDIYLLSKANYRLLTGTTTYGYLGAIIAGQNNTFYR